MLDVNRNGVIEPEEEALGDALAEEAAGQSDNMRRSAVPWLMIGAGIVIILLIILLLVFAQ